MGDKLKLLLSHLRALYQLYQHMHWAAEGQNYYGDHLLFERLYGDIGDELDRVAEKTIGLTNDGKSIDVKEDADLTSQILNKLGDKSIDSAIEGEKALIELIKDIMSSDTTDGLENLAQEIADKHEGHIYLLQQRNKTSSSVIKLFKLAHHLDQIGAYAEADKIDAIMLEMASRVGISVPDIILLADEFDCAGNTYVASELDNIIKKNSASREEELLRQIEEARMANEKLKEQKGIYVEHEDPEKQSEEEKALQRKIRIERERKEDLVREEKAKKKLEKELNKKKVRKPAPIKSPQEVKRERDLAEEWLKTNEPERVSESPLIEPPGEDIDEPDVLVNEKDLRCSSQGHSNRPAVIQMHTGDVLGEGMPDLNFCPECAAQIKIHPFKKSIQNIKNDGLRNALMLRYFGKKY